MPLTGSVPEGRSVFCPNCGALYAVMHSQRPKSESNVAKCTICLQTIDKWNSTNVPTYKLIHQPEVDLPKLKVQGWYICIQMGHGYADRLTLSSIADDCPRINNVGDSVWGVRE